MTVKILKPCLTSTLKKLNTGDTVSLPEEELKFLPREFFEIITEKETRVIEPSRVRNDKRSTAGNTKNSNRRAKRNG